MLREASRMSADYPQPVETGLSKRQVESIAESVCADLGIEPGGDLLGPLAELGGKVHYAEFGSLEESDSGSLLVHGEGNFDIYISVNTSRTRDRFTMAHELGHYILHFLYSRQRFGRPEALQAMRYGHDRAEWEANWFAAAFLMPRDVFREGFREHDGSISRLAETFDVSIAAAEVRARTLNL